MTSAGRSVLLLALLALGAVYARRALRPAPRLGVEHPAASCEIPVEIGGQGVRCLGEGEARQRGLVAGDRLPEGGGRARMAPARIEALGAPVDVNRAAPEEIEALPGVGPGLARAIVDGRPYAGLADLDRVPGIGPARLRALAPRVRF